MKRIISLVLCLVFALTALASCTGQEHKHTFADEWSSDAENHWHAAKCEHTSEKSDLAAHTGTEDGVCDVCSFVTAYTVTVNAPDNVTVEGTLTGAPGSDVIFTATVDDAYVLTVNGAETVGEAEAKDGKLVYTVKVPAIKAAVTVDIAAIKTVYGEELESGEETITIPAAFSNFGTVTFNAPAAGKYAIVIADESGVQFGENTEENEYDFFNAYVFETDKAGEVVIKSKIFVMSIPEDGEVAFEYVIVTCEDVVLVGNEGKYTLPANVNLNISYTAPVAGLYEFSSSVENLVINDEIKSIYAFAANENGEKVTFILRLDDVAVTTFELDFKVTAFNNNSANEGENEVTLTYDEYYPVEFTAPKAGAYSIVADSTSVMFYQWNAEYSYMAGIWDDFVTENLESGEKIIFYVLASDFEATEETLKAKITITHSGYLAESDEENYDSYKSQASADGALNIFTYAFEGQTYIFTAPEGYQISVDNGETWASELEVVAEGGSINYLVKGADGNCNVTIKEFEYRIDLVVGTTTVTMTAGVEYNVYVSGFTSQAMYKSIVISWNNANVSGYAGWAEVNSGDTINYITEEFSAATLMLDADADAEVTFTVTDVTSDEENGGSSDIGGEEETPSGTAIVLGENSIVVSNAFLGVFVTFTAPEAGTYVLSPADGELNATCGAEDAYGFSTFEFPHEFTLEEGESYSFLVMTDNFEPDTIDIVISKK